MCCACYVCLFVNTVGTKIKACSALNAMFVDTVNTGVYGFYTTLYTEHSTLYTGPLTPPRQKATVHCTAFHLVGLAVHQSVQGGSFVKFLGLVKLQG